MVMTDPIADLLTRIRNANIAKMEKFEVGYSNIKIRVVEILKEKGFVSDFKVSEENKIKSIKVQLKYGPGKERSIVNLVRVSTPGLRRYVKHDEIKRIRGGLGISIISTSKGIMTGEEARRQKLGGEFICYVW